MKTLMTLRSILSMLMAVMVCMIVAGLGLYLFTGRGAEARRNPRASRMTTGTNPLVV